MRSALVLLLATGLTGCDAILGIGDHSLGEGPDTGVSVSVTTTSTSTSTSSSTSSRPPDGGSEGGAVASVSCSGDAAICVVGAIESVGRTPGDGGTGVMADGAIITLTDDGFELGGTSCDSTGMKCVTGALSP